MRKQIYTAVSEALTAAGIGIEHIDLFNNQVLYGEEEQPFLTPAVFIEFADIEWQKQLHGVREAVVNIKLHVVTDTRVGRWHQSADRLELADDINRCLHGLHFSISNGDNQPESIVNDLTLLRSQTDSDFGELAVDVEEYQCHVTDASGYGRF